MAKWAGYSCQSSFKEAIHNQIFLEKLRSRRANIEKYIGDELVKRIKIDVPRSLCEEQYDKLFQQEMYNLKLKGAKDDDLKKYQDDIKKRLEPIAETQVKIYYIIAAIAKKESLAVDESNIYDTVIGYILSCAKYV